MDGEVSSIVVVDGDGLDAAAGKRDEPLVDVGSVCGVVVVVDVGLEPGDAGTCVAEEYAVDDGGGRAVGEGDGEPREGLPAAAPGAGERGGADGVAEVEAGEDLVEDLLGQGEQSVGVHRTHRHGLGIRNPALLARAARSHFVSTVPVPPFGVED